MVFCHRRKSSLTRVFSTLHAADLSCPLTSSSVIPVTHISATMISWIVFDPQNIFAGKAVFSLQIPAWFTLSFLSDLCSDVTSYTASFSIDLPRSVFFFHKFSCYYIIFVCMIMIIFHYICSSLHCNALSAFFTFIFPQ